ncbi:hypothetical protein AB0I81_00075 [Nonomuraea sp. NPDC050404]
MSFRAAAQLLPARLSSGALGVSFAGQAGNELLGPFGGYVPIAGPAVD